MLTVHPIYLIASNFVLLTVFFLLQNFCKMLEISDFFFAIGYSKFQLHVEHVKQSKNIYSNVEIIN